MTTTRRAATWTTLATLISVSLAATNAVAGGSPLAAPDDAELFAAYRSDGSNQKAQTWDDYRSWVHTFYKGNFMSAGWSRFGEATLSPVKAPEARQAVAGELTELGRIIGLEWAKDASVRKIDTTDLRRWNDQIAAARKIDDGSGKATLEALRAVRKLAESRR
ncbi:hypothetical protein [Paludisphaera rhizosphaerae]|uniref:hypothetical protein n=1 Tax=Paludisphaera rhizosphaerae TaxID=2711216 RepID=UPI0013EC3416|nr:hypothetical protein [Paludisphaera rhizosphaerae]